MIYKKDRGFESSSILNFDDGVNIAVLSPSLYWYKKLEIPTKNSNKAKNIATHMLSDRPSFYDTVVLKKYQDGYGAYGYNKKDIEDFLKAYKDTKLKIYFANEIGITNTVAVDDSLYLYPFGDSIVEVHEKNQSDETLQDFVTNKKLPKPILNISNNASSSNAVLWSVSILMVISFCFYAFGKITTIDAIQSKINTIDYDQKSGYEIKALIKKYKNINDTQHTIKGI